MRPRPGVRLPGCIFIPIIPVLAYFKTTICCGAVAGRMVRVLYDMSVCQAQGRGGSGFRFFSRSSAYVQNTCTQPILNIHTHTLRR